jgi:ADP-heptose:LPS heptosyltransferase
VWAASESRSLIAWRPLECKIEIIDFAPRSTLTKLGRAWRLLQLLAKYRARTFVSLRHSPDAVRDLVLAYVAADERHALSAHLIPGASTVVPHEIMRHYAILKGMGLEPTEVRWLLPAIAGRQDAPSRRVVLAPFSSATIKDWRPQWWSEVAQTLAARGLEIAIWVAKDQKARAEDLAEVLSDGAEGPIVSVRSGTLEDLAMAISEAPLVLTVDTFSAHLAAALDIPMVCLIGGGHYGDFGPWQNSPRQHWITNPLPCFGCDWICSRDRVECVQDITVNQVCLEIEAALMPS